ncbi:MAG TPA: hypothetical protein VHV32_04295, partial [Candidatus Angelobacter sp.]|nr:hypothetical protein [Candidatus Angelobacter sp.]
MRVAVTAMLLVFLGPSVFALALTEDGRRAPASASDSALPASTAVESAASATTAVSPNAVVATALPDAPPIPGELKTAELKTAEIKTAEASPAGTLSMPAPTAPLFGSDFLNNNNLAPIHALLTPPTALITLKPQPRTHSFFDARNRL